MIHICWPWVANCGHVFRLWVQLPWGRLEIGLTPNSRLQRYDRKRKRWTDESVWWQWVPYGSGYGGRP